MTALPTPANAEQEKVIDAVFALFQLSSDWPTYDEVDKYLDHHRSLSDADMVLLTMSADLVAGLGHLRRIPTDHQIQLKVAAIAACKEGVELVRAFVDVVAFAARLEQERLAGEPQPTISPQMLERSIDLPAAGREQLLRQLGNVLGVERWGWTAFGQNYPWSFEIGKDVRRFREISSIEEYWSLAYPDSGSEDRASAVDEVTAPVARAQPVPHGPKSWHVQPARILEPDEGDHGLRWPREPLRQELLRVFALIDRPAVRFRRLPEHIDRLLRQAFVSSMVSEEFSSLLSFSVDEFAERRITGVAVDWLRHLIAELDELPAGPAERQYYSRRHGRLIEQPASREDTVRRLVTVVDQLQSDGLFAEAFGMWCPDADDAGETPDEMFRRNLRRTIDADMWPLKPERVVQWETDDLYDLLEVLHDQASWPGVWDRHDFGGCPGHPGSFSRPCGQALYRWRINQVLDDSEFDVRLAETGEDRGRIVQVVAASTDVVIDAALAAPISGNEDVVAHAVAAFRSRQRTSASLRSAIVDLAGVLEAHRDLMKRTLLTKDENALFEIANRFDLRHRNDKQRGDYDVAFSEWLFQWYLATVTLTSKLLQRDDTQQ